MSEAKNMELILWIQAHNLTIVNTEMIIPRNGVKLEWHQANGIKKVTPFETILKVIRGPWGRLIFTVQIMHLLEYDMILCTSNS